MRIDLAANEHIGATLVTMVQPGGDDALFAPLTRRQKQVANLVAAGLANQDIAERLGITLGTVKDHVHAILDRLDLPSRVALTVAARAMAEEQGASIRSTIHRVMDG